jgi:hypothetical protein
MIGADEVVNIISSTLPEFESNVREHLSEWPNEPMLYPLLSDLVRFMLKMPEGKTKREFVKRTYDLAEEMLLHGTKAVSDAFAIELVEPFSGESVFHGSEEAIVLTSMGPTCRKLLEEMREWTRLYERMKGAIDRENASLKTEVFLGIGIGNRNTFIRIIVDTTKWASLPEPEQDKVYQRLLSDWESLSKMQNGLAITGPRETGFRLLR